MFSSLISTIAICGVLQAIITIIAPESKMKNSIISITNVVFVSAIFLQILDILKNILGD